MIRWVVLTAVCGATLAVRCITAAAEPGYDESAREHWSLQPRGNPQPPAFSDPADQAWTRTAIDGFILAKLKQAGLRPAAEADRRTLIRRLSFDLTGLPPTPDEVTAFIADPAGDAYERLMDRLLASPRYGERWGQHWLDVVRFAETEGFEYDRHLPDGWRYRDYVINAFNADKPYDRFLLEQLAGDELDSQDQELLIAAGFHRLGPVRRNAGNQQVASSRGEVLTEMTNVVGTALLGLTVGCARCHDHMFDPILQKDYYRLQAFFAATHEDNRSLAPNADETAWKTQTDRIMAEIDGLKEQLSGLSGETRAPLEAKLAEAESRLPLPLPTIVTVRNNPDERTQIHVLTRGDWSRPGEAVGPRVLGVLLPESAPELTADIEQPRTRLAQWIVDPANPLTARVIVNRIWHYHFGRGLVNTPNDFGRNGGAPSHPELLDWLANQFVAGGWSIKKLHRLMLLSNTYQQSSNPQPSTLNPQPFSNPQSAICNPQSVDPENRRLWRFNRRRLEAEELRDAMLAVSGRLNLKTGGPSVIVPVEQDLIDLLYKPAQWAVTPDPTEHNRRSVYLLAKRNLRLPFMETFDQPDLQISCARRESSTHPPQALELLNGRLSNELAEAFAARLLREAGTEPAKQVELAFALAAGRSPTERERGLAVGFLREQSLREFALAVLNLNAFLYVE
ncbi:MAG: DUF1553 domain-containing protein [Planctomycetes bacterium]|nr:DUF1553 domain-containing protein [Planctomycetota bacterium]